MAQARLKSPSYCANRVAHLQLQQSSSPGASVRLHYAGGVLITPSPNEKSQDTFTDTNMLWLPQLGEAPAKRKFKLQLKFLAERRDCLNSPFLISEVLLLTRSLEHKVSDLTIHPHEEQSCGRLSEPLDCATWDAPSLRSGEY